MDEALINNWNAKVPKDGIVYHLGDFAWGSINYWKKIREQLNGEIILIYGRTFAPKKPAISATIPSNISKENLGYLIKNENFSKFSLFL